MILIKDLATRIGIDRSTALKAIKKMRGIQIHKVKVKGVGSLMSAIDEEDIKAVEVHFGLNTKRTLHGKLTKREGDILVMRFLQEKTIGEVATKYAVTRERIRIIEEKALRRLIGFEINSLN